MTRAARRRVAVTLLLAAVAVVAAAVVWSGVALAGAATMHARGGW